jgi:hypothetical protein
MGTLLNQRPRYETLGTMGVPEFVWSIAKEMGFKREKMTPAEWHAVCDVARTALALQSADVFDEQLAGFGEILKELVEALAPREEGA